MTMQDLLKKYENMLSDCQKKVLPGFVVLEEVVEDLRKVVEECHG